MQEPFMCHCAQNVVYRKWEFTLNMVRTQTAFYYTISCSQKNL